MIRSRSGGPRHVIVRWVELAAIEEICAAHEGERAAIVCHASVINAYTSHGLGIESDMFFLPMNTSITVVRALGEHRAIHRMNDYEHLVRPVWAMSAAAH